MFTDTRLYVSVRPYAEYGIPDAAQLVLRTIIGDIPPSVAEEALRGLSGHPSLVHESVSSVQIGTLNSQCMRVINHAVEHLRQIETNWIEYLTRVRNGMTTEARSIRRDIRDADRVYRQYKSTHRNIAEREYKREMNHLSRKMDDAVAQYRSMDPPTTPRSDEFCAAASALRESFATSYGTVDTASLMCLRQYFEYELVQAQRPIVASFCDRCRKLLEL